MDNKPQSYKYISHGTDGCIIRGHLECSDKDINQYYMKHKNKYTIMKIRDQISDVYIVDVIHILNKIDSKQLYFIYEHLMEGYKYIYMMDCEVLGYNSDLCDLEIEKPFGYIMADGGIDLDTYFTDITNINIHYMFNILTKIIKLLQILQKYKIIHKDLKLQNILIDNKQCIRIIDFNLSFVVNKKLDILDHMHSYAKPITNEDVIYPVHPPFLNVLYNKDMTDEEHNYYYKISYDYYYSRLKLSNNDYYKTLLDMAHNYKSDYLALINKYLFNIDIFSIGYCFLHYCEKYIDKLKEDKLYEPVCELLRGMANVQPDYQYNLKDTILRINSIYGYDVLSLYV